jgi:uncharacterized membrane protein YcaP (DUF421 family)
MFALEGAKVFEIVVRVTIIYAACMVLLRISGRRELSQLAPMDLLAMLLLSETVSPALTEQDTSVTSGLVAAAMLLALCVLTSILVHRFPRAERILQGHAVVLIEDGKVNRAVLDRYRMTNEDVELALHEGGLLDVSDVRRGFVETDGRITLVKKAG